MTTTREQRRARRALFKLLSKLGIKSAGPYPGSGVLTPKSFEDIMDDMMDNFGQPDMMFMDGSALQAYMNLMKLAEPSITSLQSVDTVGPVQSEGAPADKRGR